MHTKSKGLLRQDSVSQGRSHQLSRDFIMRTLDLYNVEHILVDEAVWHDRSLRGCVRYQHYPFTKPGHIEYMTAAMALVYVSQISYVNARMLILQDPEARSLGVSDRDFFSARDAGNLIFTQTQVRFRSKLWSTMDRFEFSHSLHSVRSRNGFFFIRFDARLHGAACQVSGTFAMPVNQ